jgi:predicted naringenin-chalcone synthase
MVSVGTARPPARFLQDQIATLLNVPDGLGRRFFTGGGIDARHLFMTATIDGALPEESQEELLQRHRRGSLELGREALESCLRSAGKRNADIDFLCCVSSTGFMLPGLSAMYLRHLGFRPDCHRNDIVGMGCNAALNALNTAASWAATHAGHPAVVVCCEVNSAIHVRDDRIVTSLVNSLFGDGCGALFVSTDDDVTAGPEILGFSSYVVADAWRAISYHWSPAHHKFELYLDKKIPNVLGAYSPTPISALLERFSLHRRDIKHWLIHAGGKKVIEAVADANGLTEYDVRHATNVLRCVGNLGSATVLFSYEELLKEGTAARGDYGVMVTMGPGATIETALLRW